MRRFHSIRWRLQFWYGLLLAAVLLGFGLTAFEYEQRALLRGTDAELARRAGLLARSLGRPAPAPRRPAPPQDAPPGDHPPPDAEAQDEPRPSGPPEDPLGLGSRVRDQLSDQAEPAVPADEAAAYAGDTAGGWYYVIWRRHEPRVTRSANAPADVPQPERREFVVRGANLRARGNCREAFVPLAPGDALLVGRVMDADLRQLRAFGWLLAAAAGGTLVSALLIGSWLVGRSLRPISEIGEAASRIAAGNLGERIATGRTDSELGQLATVLNATFARLEAAFAQQARFTADAAHELRTPVTVLLTHTENALSVGCPADEHREAFEACRRAARRMRALIESLLQLARIDARENPAPRTSFDLARRVSDIVELVRPLAAQRAIAIDAELPSTPCQGDPAEVDLVVTNLLTNAIHHNFEGGRIRVTTEADGDRARLTVADTGPGIDPRHVPHLFERFYRVDVSRSRGSGGSGLGLAIAKAIVDAHGGTIAASSTPGRGATFTVSLPAPRTGG